MNTSLLRRIADGRTDLVHDVLTRGGPAHTVDDGGVSLIQWCAYYGDVSAIRVLLSSGESLSSLGQNLDLNGAAFHGHWRLCQFLIENGAKVNHPHPDNGETPLHAALCRPDRPSAVHVVRVLLSAGADPHRVTKVSAPTDCFMRDARTRGEAPLHRAAAFGREDVIQLLVDAGAKIDAKDMNGDSPLSWASWHNRPAYILQMLCYDGFTIHPQAAVQSRLHHRAGWGNMEQNLLGRPGD